MLVVPAKKLLVIASNAAAKILAAIPHSKAFKLEGRDMVAVPHGVEEALVLRNIGFKTVPSPILSYYKWPGRYKPMEHQRATAAFFVGHRKALCLNAPGTGKTASSLWAADYLMTTGAVKRVLIVCPVSTMRSVWAMELKTVLPQRHFEVLAGSRERRLELLGKPELQYAVINHDGFKVVHKDLTEFDLVIYDEATALKNPSTDRFTVFNQWVHKNNPWLWLLTGTPFSQTPVDAWALAKLVASPTLKKTYTGFRDTVMNKVSTFRWVPRDDALATCRHVLQPSIRYTLDECVDLPQTVVVDRQTSMSVAQTKAFKEMKDKAVLTLHDVTAVNAAVVMQKLIQIVCIGYNTPVLTNRGWKPIQAVGADDLVWDGVEWVAHGGVVLQGEKGTITCGGVQMTPEHLVLTTEGWKTARDTIHGESSKRLNRASVRLPESPVSCRDGRDPRWHTAGNVAVQMPVREQSGCGEPSAAEERSPSSQELWVPVGGMEQVARHVEDKPLLYVDGHAGALYRRAQQGLEKLRSAWHQGLCSLAEIFCGVLGRHVRHVLSGADVGQAGQRQGVQPQQLSVGDANTTGEQQKKQPHHCHPERGDACGAGGKIVGAETDHCVPTAGSRVERGTSAEARRVYDILNCGPRNRFVVRGSGGELSIVHNCGVVYGNDGERHEIDASARLEDLKELIDEAGDKVIVYVPLRGVQDWLAAELEKEYGVGCVASVHGDVPLGERTKIFNAFQTTDPNLRVLIAHPKVASHGLTLTAARTVIWYAPIYSLEAYEQANARIRRIGTTGKTRVIHLYATGFEKELYSRLQHKKRVLSDFLELVSGVNYGE